MLVMHLPTWYRNVVEARADLSPLCRAVALLKAGQLTHSLLSLLRFPLSLTCYYCY